jgi:hypothetical protein
MNSSRPSRPSRRGATIALLLAGIAVGALLCEGAIRMLYGDKFGARPGFYIGDDKLGWRPTPNLDHTFYGSDFEIDVVTDGDGYRLGALGAVDDDARLFVLSGDSFTFGWGVSTRQSYASHLDEALHAASDGEARAVNLGVGAYGLFQSFDRLGRFLVDREGANVVAILVQHSPNDPTDNFNKLGYHLEMWKTADKAKSRSPLHVVNVVAFAREAMHSKEQAPTEGERHPYLQDMLFGYDRLGRYVPLPETVVVHDMMLSLAGLSDADTDAELTLRRGSLTDRQRAFMAAAINIFNRMGLGAGVPVFHMAIYTSPSWYVGELEALIGQSVGVAEGAVVNWGRVPATGSYDGEVLNAHGGGHYTPELNAFWAADVHRRLTAHGLR